MDKFFRIENGLFKGFYAEILDKILVEDLNVNYSADVYPWLRAQTFVRNNLADAMITIVTPERLGYSINSKEPIFTLNLVVYLAANNKDVYGKLSSISSYNDLKELKLVTYKGDGYGESLFSKENGFDLTVVYNPESIFHMLLSGRSDAWVQADLSGDAIINLFDYSNHIVKLPEVLDSVNFYLFVSKQSKYLSILDRFDESLRKMKSTPFYSDLLSRYGVPIL